MELSRHLRATLARNATCEDNLSFLGSGYGYATWLGPVDLLVVDQGAALAYGRDPWTGRIEQRFAEIFEREVAVFLVATGTAANALAPAHYPKSPGGGPASGRNEKL